MKFTLYRSNCLEVPENCTYPHKVEVTGKDSLIDAVKHDYVCAEYQGNYRSNDNFIGSDCLPVDCDNDHSDDPEEWVYPSDVATAFPGVAFAVHYSRNHMKAKGGKAARPKFHVFFAIDRVIEPGQYSEMKKLQEVIRTLRRAGAVVNESCGMHVHLLPHSSLQHMRRGYWRDHQRPALPEPE